MRRIALLGALFIALAVLCVSMTLGVDARVAASFTPTPTITVEMWRLQGDGAYYVPNQRCSQADNVKYTWGCTAYCNDSDKCAWTKFVAYPFSSENATMDIEGTSCLTTDSPYNCYLRDVVPLEVAIKVSSRDNKPLAVVEAQAIAARTYTYNRTWGRDNSTNYHVFVPFYYDTLSSDQQLRVNAAAASVYYMSYYDSDSPIAALYGSDNGAQTSQGGYPYLMSVPDPISAAYGSSFDTGNGGLSSRGAGRWGFGHTSSWGPDYEGSAYYPHDENGDGDFWSVRYDSSFQILAHYYTRIHIRDVANGNAILTPSWRGNVLQVNWARPKGYPDGICSRIEVRLQNTGTTTWYGANGGYWDSKVGLGYCWNGGTCVPAGFLPRSVEPGGDLWVTLLVPPWSGSGDLQIDLYWQAGNSSITWFPNWPRQGIGTFSAVPTYCMRLPFMNWHEPVN